METYSYLIDGVNELLKESNSPSIAITKVKPYLESEGITEPSKIRQIILASSFSDISELNLKNTLALFG